MTGPANSVFKTAHFNGALFDVGLLEAGFLKSIVKRAVGARGLEKGVLGVLAVNVVQASHASGSLASPVNGYVLALVFTFVFAFIFEDIAHQFRSGEATPT